MNHAYLGLGSNINKEENMVRAVGMLRELSSVVVVSPIFETVPVGLFNQPNFLNGAALLHTDLPPAELRRDVLTLVEARLGRARQADKNAPRTIDIDLLLYNDSQLEYEGHFLPHRDILRFAHVAVPLALIAPTLHHPETGESLLAIASRLLQEAAGPDGSFPLWPRYDVRV